MLPFGLSTAPYIFAKLLKPLETRWRLLNIDIVLFLDDGWSAEKNFQLYHSDGRQVQQDLADSGFISNDSKSVWEPTQQIEWLGLLLNSRKGTLSLVHRRVDKISNSIEHITKTRFIISVGTLASFVGQIICTEAVVGTW